jgi:hypothetical protein
MSRLRDRLVEGWDGLLGASMVAGALVMLLQWRRQRRRLRKQLDLAETGWERPDA